MSSRWTDLGSAVLPGVKSPSTNGGRENGWSQPAESVNGETTGWGDNKATTETIGWGDDKADEAKDPEPEAEAEATTETAPDPEPEVAPVTDGDTPAQTEGDDRTEDKAENQTAELVAPEERPSEMEEEVSKDKDPEKESSPRKLFPCIPPSTRSPPPRPSPSTSRKRSTTTNPSQTESTTAPLNTRNVRFLPPDIPPTPRSPSKARVLDLQERLLSETAHSFMAYEMKISAMEDEIKSLKAFNSELEGQVQKMVDDARSDLETCEFEIGEISDKLRLFPRTLKRTRIV